MHVKSTMPWQTGCGKRENKRANINVIQFSLNWRTEQATAFIQAQQVKQVSCKRSRPNQPAHSLAYRKPLQQVEWGCSATAQCKCTCDPADPLKSPTTRATLLFFLHVFSSRGFLFLYKAFRCRNECCLPLLVCALETLLFFTSFKEENKVYIYDLSQCIPLELCRHGIAQKKRRGKHSHGPFPPGWPIFKLHSATQF